MTSRIQAYLPIFVRRFARAGCGPSLRSKEPS